MKKFLSTILAVVMVLSSMAMVVSAEETLEDGIYVGTTKYDTFTAAQTAAAANTTNKEIIISGTVEFGSRQGISVEGLHLRGINNAQIIPSATYGNSTSDTNKKGLLNVAADNVKISNITFDGSDYGDTITMTTSPDFIVLRLNEGENIQLDNVTVKGSPRTLIVVGTTTTSAEVEVLEGGLYCEGDVNKDISDGTTYADINVANGSFTMAYGKANAFIAEDHEEKKGTATVTAPGHFTFGYTKLLATYDIITTPKHIADTYLASEKNWLGARNYVKFMVDNNDEVIEMLEYVNENQAAMNEEMTDLNDMLDDMIEQDENSIFFNYLSYLNNYKSVLNAVSAE